MQKYWFTLFFMSSLCSSPWDAYEVAIHYALTSPDSSFTSLSAADALRQGPYYVVRRVHHIIRGGSHNEGFLFYEEACSLLLLSVELGFYDRDRCLALFEKLLATRAPGNDYVVPLVSSAINTLVS